MKKKTSAYESRKNMLLAKIEKIELVRYYDGLDEPCGIGYQNAKLVRYIIPKRGLPKIESLTLIESLDWCEKMELVEMNDKSESICSQWGDYQAELRWIREIRADLLKFQEITDVLAKLKD